MKHALATLLVMMSTGAMAKCLPDGRCLLPAQLSDVPTLISNGTPTLNNPPALNGPINADFLRGACWAASMAMKSPIDASKTLGQVGRISMIVGDGVSIECE